MGLIPSRDLELTSSFARALLKADYVQYGQVELRLLNYDVMKEDWRKDLFAIGDKIASGTATPFIGQPHSYPDNLWSSLTGKIIFPVVEVDTMPVAPRGWTYQSHVVALRFCLPVFENEADAIMVKLAVPEPFHDWPREILNAGINN